MTVEDKSDAEVEDGKKKVSIERGLRPVITETGKGDKIEYHEIPVPPPGSGRKPANSPQ